MKKYLPIVIGVLLVAAGAILARQYAKRTSITPASRENFIQINPSEEVSEVPTSTAKEPVSLVSGITLTVSSPSNNTTVSNSSVTVKGKTVAAAEVFVNDSVTKADDNGNFSVTLSLEEGDNYILVVANDAAGNYSEKELNITYAP